MSATTSGRSSYLELLPPVLWEHDAAPPAFSLGGMLQVFEKLLTGIGDGVPIQHGDHTHVSIADEIASLPDLYDPRRTRSSFLPWLASWVALRFPSIWTEYQQRKLTAQMVGIYSLRGLRDGLHRYLELYTVAATRPRGAVDDGSRLLVAQLAPGTYAQLSTLVSQWPSIHRPVPPPPSPPQGVPGPPTLDHQGPVRTAAVARGPAGHLFLADHGTMTIGPLLVNPNVWRVSPAGEYDYTGAPPAIAPIDVTVPSGQTWAPFRPIALTVDSPAQPASTTPWTLYVLDQVLSGPDVGLYKLTAPGPAAGTFTVAATVTLLNLGPTYHPIAMSLVPGTKTLAVLDGGSGAAHPPKLVLLDVSGATPTVTGTRALTSVSAPLSAMALSNGDVIVGDGGNQFGTGPGRIWRVPSTGAPVNVLANLPAAANPLAAPTAMLRLSDTSVLVADAGLKPVIPTATADMIIAEPAAIYRVDLAAATVTRVSESGRLVFPSGLAGDATQLYVSDLGEYADVGWAGTVERVWRASASEFGVSVHFSSARSPGADRDRILGDIVELVSREKPAHALWTLVYRRH